MHEELVERNIDWKKDRHLVWYFARYAYPFLLLFLVAIILLIINTAIELSFPVLFKRAIDDYIAKKDDSITGNASIDLKNNFILDNLKNTRLILDDNKIKYRKYKNKIIISKERYSKINRNILSKIRKHDLDGIYKIFLLYWVLLLINLAAVALMTYIIGVIGQKIIFSLRSETFKKMLQLKLSYFHKNPLGRLVTRITNDVEAINDMITSVGAFFVKDIVLITGIIGVMCYMNFELTVIAMIFFPFLLSFTAIFAKKWRILYRNSRIKLAEVNAFLSEHISMMNLIKIYRRENKVKNDYAEKNQNLFDARFEVRKSNALFSPSISFTQNLTMSAVLVYGGSLILKQHLSIGELVAYTAYIRMLFSPIRDLAEKFNIIQSSIAAMEKVYSIMTSTEKEENDHESSSYEISKGEIEFKNVYFKYSNDWILKDVNFKIRPGEKIAIVGYTGAGKTTIINLLLRYYDIQSGDILIDGIPLKKFSLRNLRKAFSLVQQDVTAFTDSIRENISFGGGDEKRILESLKIVELENIIDRFKNGLDGKLSEDAGNLSVGERQLLSFARAVYKDSVFLILDEATSNIDSITEDKIQRVLFDICRDKTSIIIAHRLATIKHVDRIIVIHKGKVVEIGFHEELLANRGIYYRLYKLQWGNG